MPSRNSGVWKGLVGTRQSLLNRRDFITSTALAAAALTGCATSGTPDEGRIMTVTGAIRPGDGAAALDEIRLLGEEGVAPRALIWVHAMNDPGPIQIQAAQLGAWISLDGYSLAAPNVLRLPNFLAAHREAGTLNRVLLWHDDGWAVDGDAPTGNKLTLFGNGNPAPYEAIFTRLLPDLRAKGFTEAQIDQMLVTNPRKALTILPRLLDGRGQDPPHHSMQ